MGNLFPRIYDLAMAPLERVKLKKVRKSLIDKATGRVLEIGSGTGLNFTYYTNASKVDAVEPNRIMRDRSLRRKFDSNIQSYLMGAEKLPFADNTFDSVVATLVFCTIPDPEQVLHEIERVSKPGAKLLVLEHVRLNHKLLSTAQDLLTPLWKKVCDGCHLNRDPLTYINKTNLAITDTTSFYGGLFVTIDCQNHKL